MNDFFRAIIRRAGWIVGGVLVYALLSVAGIGVSKAHATTFQQAMTNCQSISAYTCSDNGEKNCEYGNALAPGSGQICGVNVQQCGGPTHTCQAYSYAFTPCVLPEKWSTIAHKCMTPCEDRADMHMSGWGYHAGDTFCHDGCVWGQMPALGGQIAMGGTCDADPPCTDPLSYLVEVVGPSKACRDQDSDGDGTPDRDDAYPNNPNESSDTDGDGIGDKGDSAPNDADNGKDDGEGDEKDNESSGGGDCNTPPASHGDGIAAQIAFQTWKTRCALEKVTNGDGKLKTDSAGLCVDPDGSGPQTCTGGGNSSGSVIIGGVDMSGPQPGEGDVTGNGTGEEGAGSVMGENGGDAAFDMGGWGWSRSCPSIPDVTVMGTSLHFDTSVLCNWLALGGWFVLLIANIAAIRILLSA